MLHCTGKPSPRKGYKNLFSTAFLCFFNAKLITCLKDFILLFYLPIHKTTRQKQILINTDTDLGITALGQTNDPSGFDSGQTGDASKQVLKGPEVRNTLLVLVARAHTESFTSLHLNKHRPL